MARNAPGDRWQQGRQLNEYRAGDSGRLLCQRPSEEIVAIWRRPQGFQRATDRRASKNGHRVRPRQPLLETLHLTGESLVIETAELPDVVVNPNASGHRAASSPALGSRLRLVACWA